MQGEDSRSLPSFPQLPATLIWHARSSSKAGMRSTSSGSQIARQSIWISPPILILLWRTSSQTCSMLDLHVRSHPSVHGMECSLLSTRLFKTHEAQGEHSSPIEQRLAMRFL